jgi:Mg2+/citrate symporter
LDLWFLITNKRQRIPQVQSKMDNPEKLATSSTQDKTNKAKTTQYALETTTTNLNILVLLAIILSFCLRITASDYLFGIFKLLFNEKL